MRKNSFIPALKYRFLTPYYDGIIRLLMPEERVKWQVTDLADLQPGERLLDFGCGTGTLLQQLQGRRDDIECTGYDVDEEILDLARRKNIPDVRWVLGDVTVLPFEDAYFDKVVSTWVFHHLDRRAKEIAFRELRRVLKPGGLMIVADWGLPGNLLMRFLFFIIQLIDNFHTTTDNVKGRLPGYMRDASFGHAVEVARKYTLFGTLSFYKAW